MNTHGDGEHVDDDCQARGLDGLRHGFRRRGRAPVVRREPDAEMDGIVDPYPQGYGTHEDRRDVDRDPGEAHDAEHHDDGEEDRDKPHEPAAP